MTSVRPIVGASVEITLEVQGDMHDGASDKLVRDVTENCRTFEFHRLRILGAITHSQRRVLRRHWIFQMYLSCVEIENFRSLKSLKVDFQPGLNVLVGRNNTGKTNILKAIRQALGPAASRSDSLWLDRDDFFKESVSDTTNRTIRITLAFSDLF